LESTTLDIISSFGTAFGAIATFLTVLLVIYKDNFKNFLNPIDLDLQIVDDCENGNDIIDQNFYDPLEGINSIKIERHTTYYFLKIMNKKRARNVNNVSLKYTGMKINGINDNFHEVIPQYLLMSPIEERNTSKTLNDCLYFGLLRCYNDNGNSYQIELCTNRIIPIYKTGIDEGLISIRLEIEAEGLLFDKVYEVAIEWNRRSIDCMNFVDPSFNFSIKEISESFSRTSYLINKINKSMESLL